MKKKRMIIRDKKKFIKSTITCIELIVFVIMFIILKINKINNKNIETSSQDIVGLYESNDSNLEINKNSWNLILVNKDHKLPDDFTVKLTELKSGHKIDERVYPYLQNMMDDARKEGLNPLICSSYRTVEDQTKLFNNKLKEFLNKGFSKENAEKQAAMWVAIPGTSEHHTGLAVDIVSSKYQTLDKKQEETKEQKWLIENSYKYGFILRYPTNKKEITGINYEPWHYRYVGVDDATKITEQGITLEEYLNET